jgi:hypothetical protein
MTLSMSSWGNDSMALGLEVSRAGGATPIASKFDDGDAVQKIKYTSCGRRHSVQLPLLALEPPSERG